MQDIPCHCWLEVLFSRAWRFVLSIEKIGIFSIYGTGCLKKRLSWKAGVKCWLLFSLLIAEPLSHSTAADAGFCNFFFLPQIWKWDIISVHCWKLVVWAEVIQKGLQWMKGKASASKVNKNKLCVSALALGGQSNKYSVFLSWSLYSL